MFDVFRKAAMAGLGAISWTKEMAEQAAEELIKRGELKKDDTKEFVENILKRGEEQRKELVNLIGREVDRFKTELRLANKADLERLEARIKALEDRLATDDN